MNKTADVRNKEQIKKRMQVGDLLTAAKMLGITTDAARMRLNRLQPEIVEALEKVIKAREELIKIIDMKNKNQYFITVFRPSLTRKNGFSQIKCLYANAENEDAAIDSKKVQKVVNAMYGKEIHAHIEYTDGNYIPTGCHPYIYILTKPKAILS